MESPLPRDFDGRLNRSHQGGLWANCAGMAFVNSRLRIAVICRVSLSTRMLQGRKSKQHSLNGPASPSWLAGSRTRSLPLSSFDFDGE